MQLSIGRMLRRSLRLNSEIESVHLVSTSSKLHSYGKLLKYVFEKRTVLPNRQGIRAESSRTVFRKTFNRNFMERN